MSWGLCLGKKRATNSHSGPLKLLLLIQTIYYFITGVWPVVHIKSFMAVTGPKTDIWLVKTVGVLITAISICFYAAWQTTIELSIILLAVSAALFLLCIDIYYAGKRVISPIYLVDAGL